MTRLNLGCGPHHLPGFENLNPPEWRFEDGLPYPDGSVEGITCSHSLMYVAVKDWPFVFREIARVLAPGGIVRITEDDTENEASERHAEPWPDAVTLTGPRLVRKHLRVAGLVVQTRDADTTGFVDGTLMQAHHGQAPKCFWIEGRKPAGGEILANFSTPEIAENVKRIVEAATENKALADAAAERSATKFEASLKRNKK